MNPMFSQYKQKKKRAVNPDAPPRPTLLGHEKQLKERQTEFEQYKQHTDAQIERLQKKIRGLESTVDKLISVLRK